MTVLAAAAAAAALVLGMVGAGHADVAGGCAVASGVEAKAPQHYAEANVSSVDGCCAVCTAAAADRCVFWLFKQARPPPPHTHTRTRTSPRTLLTLP